MNSYKKYDDLELFAFFKAGDERAFCEIYERYWGVLYRHTLRLLKDEDTAEDVVQEVFVNLWDKARELDISLSISSYLYASVRNRVLNVIQKEKHQEKYINSFAKFLNNSEATTDHRLREQMLKERIETAVHLLPRKMKNIFEMSRVRQLSYKEIAQELNISDKTVKKQVSNAIKILRLKLSSLITLAFWMGFWN